MLSTISKHLDSHLGTKLRSQAIDKIGELVWLTISSAYMLSPDAISIAEVFVTAWPRLAVRDTASLV